MRKKSWAYGSIEPLGDDSYTAMDPPGPEAWYDSLVTEKSVSPDTQAGQGYGGGIFFPADEGAQDVDDDEAQAMLEMSSEFMKRFCDSSSVLGIDDDPDGAALAVSRAGHRFTNLTKNADDTVNIKDFHQEHGSPMFHTFRDRFDAFYIKNASCENNNLEISLNNIKRCLRPVASGMIAVEGSRDVSDLIERAGFEVHRKHVGKVGKYIVSQNLSNKTAVVRYYGKPNIPYASVAFECDVAKTTQERVDGLQVYSKLEKNAGLVFPYDRPTDVSFHMGSVGYPIDIIFIDDESKIKKICKNIQPGSPGIYACAGISHVLEISGGLSESLGLKRGGLMYVDQGGSFGPSISKAAACLSSLGANNLIYKRSNTLGPGLYMAGRDSIYVLGEESESATSLIKRASADKPVGRGVAAFDIDGLILKEGSIVRLYRHTQPDLDGKIYRGVDGESMSIIEGSYIDVEMREAVSSEFKRGVGSKYSVIPSRFMSFSGLHNSDRSDALRRIHAASQDASTDVILISRGRLDKPALEGVIQREIEVETGMLASVNSELVRVPDNFGTEDVFSALGERYAGRRVELYSGMIVKAAGIPVPDDVKGNARKALRYFERSRDMCDTLTEKLKQNVEAYGKVQGDVDAIANSKGQYSQSSKRNSRILKRSLINIRNGIKILNEIKDVSSTSEVISSVATSAKNCSAGLKEVFDLISIIESDDFTNQMNQKTDGAESLLEDMRLALERARDYISSDILGILILSA